jgi:uncharacterized protein (DUF2141 family)
MLAWATSAASSPTEPPPGPRESATIDVTISGLRNDRGVVRLALCPADAPFPDCGTAGVTQAVAIRNRSATARLTDIAPGPYAIAAFHDENRNGKLDTFLDIPREGFGFSQNPPLRPRAPKFAECSFAAAGTHAIAITMRYLL